MTFIQDVKLSTKSACLLPMPRCQLIYGKTEEPDLVMQVTKSHTILKYEMGTMNIDTIE